ncbi:MAG: ferrous iron transport protein A [Anaerolineae bacterium]|jgi:Fe2+ transport system protein FeoA|nr:ferrous iron transport protein A [Anaerolineae bacterium]
MMPLSMAASGETMVVTGIRGGFGMRRRMADLGLNIGMCVTVVSAGYNCPLLVDLKGARYALDRRLAHHVFVEPLRLS